MTDVRISLKRAKDLTDRDVIRLPHVRYLFENGRVASYSDFAGTWREIFQVYHDQQEVEAEYGKFPRAEEMRPWDKRMWDLVDDSLNRADNTMYVLLRLMVQEKSYGEYEDVFVPLYRFDLVEVQSEPTFRDPPGEGSEG